MIVKTPPVSFAALRSSIIPRTMASVAASGSASAAKTSLRVRMTAEARRRLPSPRHAAASCPHLGTAGHKPMLPPRLRQSSRASGSGLGYDIVAALTELNDHD